MPDPHTTSTALRQLDRQLGQHRQERSSGLHATRRLEQDLAAAERAGDAARARVLGDAIEQRQNQTLGNRRAERDLRQRLAAAREAYAPFSDPREHLGRWRDDVPILLFPLRLETRFRTVEVAGAAQRFQLWVRAYPDTCLIDTFEELPSETEYLRARAYWVARFRAGRAEEGASAEIAAAVRTAHLEAWRQLLDRGAPGRAYWLTDNLGPVAGQTPTVRLSPDDILLVIVTEGGGPDPVARTALTDYYTALWRARGESAAVEAATADLVAAVGGEATALDLLERYPPAGLADGEARAAADDQRIEITFLDFPAETEVDRTVGAWSDPAKVSLLPDRLLLQGYKDGKLVLDEIGPLIAQPLTIGPDPGEDIDAVLREAFPELYADGQEPDEDGKAAAYIEYLKTRSDTRWLFDFAEARRVGMGFVVDLDPVVYRGGFDRLFVTGLRLSADAETSREELESLLHHHQYGVTGLSFLPQGTPTNAATTGESLEASFDRYFAPPPLTDRPHESREDGRWFSDLLGIDATRSGLATAAYFSRTDQSESLAMQRALYPATLGYYLEGLLDTVTDEWDRRVTEEFFRHHVAPRGRMPLLRIGNQPYGVLPITGRQKGNWLRPRRGDDGSDNEQVFRVPGISDHAPVLERLLGLLNAVRADWEPKLDTVSYLWRPGDPHQALLDVLGLHATSVEWDQRMGETTKQFANRLRMMGGFGALFLALLGGAYLERTRELFLRHGIDLGGITDGDRLVRELPRIMKILFFGRINPLGGPLVDDRPLSETEPVRAYTPEGRNYLEWLVDAVENDTRRLRSRGGFTEGDHPRALLFELLRHATDLQTVNTGLRLYRSADLITPGEDRLLRRDTDFVGISPVAANAVESRYALLYRPEPAIVPAAAGNVAVIDYLSTLLDGDDADRADWAAHRAALRRLTDVPTGRLERLLAEHLDCCNYRLDAWLQGFTDLQLRALRYGDVLENEAPVTEDDTGEAVNAVRGGIYLGAFGWVEDLRPDHSERTPAELSPEQREIFLADAGTPAPHLDNQNGGYIYAPSLDHATTAAVLRNAYLGNATPEDPDRYAINLSSERVRNGLRILEGMRNGQELAALLGYQLERQLHDASLELDQYIYALRDRYPLRANKLRDTELADDEYDSVEQIAAANVVDGLALVELVNAGTAYPYDVTGLPAAGSAADAIRTAVERLADLEDAAADLALAESVHQTVKGNFDRAAGNLNAYSKGKIPPVPEVALTPRKGRQLTHRFCLHLDPDAPAPAGVLAATEPAIAAWLKDRLPVPADIGVRVEIVEPMGSDTTTVSLADLGWSVTDLLYQVDRASDDQFGNLDEALQHFVQGDRALGPAAVVHLHYTGEVTTPVSCFELLPLLADARQLLLSVRGLRPTDLRVPSEASEEEDATVTGDPAAYAAVKTDLEAVMTELQTNVITPLDAAGVTVEALADMDTDAIYATVVDRIDEWITAYTDTANTLQAYRPLNAHTDLAYSGRHGISVVSRQIVTDFHAGLAELLLEADVLLPQAAAAATAEETVALLKAVEPLVSTTFFTDSDPVAFTADVTARRDTFAAYLDDLRAFVDRDHPTLQALHTELTDLAAEATLAPLTSRRMDLAEIRNRLLVLAQDLLRAAAELAGKATLLIARADERLGPTHPEVLDATRQLLGEDYQLLPRFSLPAVAFDELGAAYADRAQLLNYQRDTLDEPFPVETWLHGLARVRPFLGHWERVQLYFEAYPGVAELDCTPLQFPLRPGEPWLGLAFPSDYELVEEKLLYTAHFARAGGPVANRFCGLLVDEWTEVIPSREEDTGLAFHFDQPATEPAQSWLLALPTDFRGGWRWNDLLAALHEALDLARLRAVEPRTFEDTAYAHLLPTTVSTVTRRPVTPSMNLAAVNGVPFNPIVTNVSS